jgi:integrase
MIAAVRANGTASPTEVTSTAPTAAPSTIASTAARRWSRGPTLDVTDLRRIVDAAGAEDPGHALRDRALVALHYFSGLRPDEIVRLCWED